MDNVFVWIEIVLYTITQILNVNKSENYFMRRNIRNHSLCFLRYSIICKEIHIIYLRAELYPLEILEIYPYLHVRN